MKKKEKKSCENKKKKLSLKEQFVGGYSAISQDTDFMCYMYKTSGLVLGISFVILIILTIIAGAYWSDWIYILIVIWGWRAVGCFKQYWKFRHYKKGMFNGNKPNKH